ncbi:DUF1127 domain-containing protein [Chelativorans sp. M5D2P16]|uniref:DUF1127 domain-containing protein n=1 Tax=Chelativorans sp. M5D2P16 TaxID=3095678 RepID=UPI002ACAD2F7|nr:DUF1127 domain-containing protein [Chelativorans sp. M5D2P16]MDZ5699914.1 DUF1127 domain-containing protein [Chelativorans sp. M5D2P16]
MPDIISRRHSTPSDVRARSLRLQTILPLLLRAEERWRQRRQLAKLDDHLLADIGLTPKDVRRECRKPFWR